MHRRRVKAAISLSNSVRYIVAFLNSTRCNLPNPGIPPVCILKNSAKGSDPRNSKPCEEWNPPVCCLNPPSLNPMQYETKQQAAAQKMRIRSPLTSRIRIRKEGIENMTVRNEMKWYLRVRSLIAFVEWRWSRFSHQSPPPPPPPPRFSPSSPTWSYILLFSGSFRTS